MLTAELAAIRHLQPCRCKCPWKRQQGGFISGEGLSKRGLTLLAQWDTGARLLDTQAEPPCRCCSQHRRRALTLFLKGLPAMSKHPETVKRKRGATARSHKQCLAGSFRRGHHGSVRAFEALRFFPPLKGSDGRKLAARSSPWGGL